MNITTNYWKTDKLIPTEIRDKIRDAAIRVFSNLFFSPYNRPSASFDRKGLTLKIPRDYILQSDGYDLDEADEEEREELWTEISSGKSVRQIIQEIIHEDMQQITNTVTTEIMDDYMNYMGILDLANTIVRESNNDNPVTRHTFLYARGRNNMKYDDDIWEKIHDENK